MNRRGDKMQNANLGNAKIRKKLNNLDYGRVLTDIVRFSIGTLSYIEIEDKVKEVKSHYPNLYDLYEVKDSTILLENYEYFNNRTLGFIEDIPNMTKKELYFLGYSHE